MKPLIMVGVGERTPLQLSLEHIVSLNQNVAERTYASLIKEALDYFTRCFPISGKLWLDIYIKNEPENGIPDWRFKMSASAKNVGDTQLREFLFLSIALVKSLLKDYNKTMIEMKSAKTEFIKKIDDYKKRALYM